MRALLAVVMICCATSAASAAASSVHMERVTAVLPDGSLRLESHGNAVLQNIFFPDTGHAEAWLAAHVLQQSIPLDIWDDDRYGRVQITSDIEEKMLRDGAAMIYASEGDIPHAWWVAEAAARHEKNGIWASDTLVLTSENAAQHLGEFHIVEGRITRIYDTKAATYLNFGEDWHTDFSITIPAKIRRSMKERIGQLTAGKTIRVRGGIYEENGPMIRLLNGDNLEID